MLRCTAPPAGALCGIPSGVAAVGAEARPSANRLGVARAPAEPGASNRFCVRRVARWQRICALGVRLPEADDIDDVLPGFLPGGACGPDAVRLADQARLAAGLDRAWLDAG